MQTTKRIVLVSENKLYSVCVGAQTYILTDIQNSVSSQGGAVFCF